MTSHITKEGLLRVLTEDVSEPMRSFILARAAELSVQESKPTAWRSRAIFRTDPNGRGQWVYRDGADKPIVRSVLDCEFEPLYAAPSVSAQDASPKDGPEPQQILVLNEQGVHAAIERTEDGKWKFSTYPDGSLFIRFPSPKDGWKLAPMQPTQAMLDAGVRAGVGASGYWCPETWAAMLAAAPEPPQ